MNDSDVTKSIIDLHGGRINVSNRSAVGAAVTIALPVITKMNRRNTRILMVDDEEGFTKLAAMTLTDYEIRGEDDSAHALAAAQEFKPDLILLDVIMPGLDGGDVAAQIRAEPRLRNVPIIFLTAMVTEGERAARPDFGGFPFIAKPVTPERLADCIEQHLGR